MPLRLACRRWLGARVRATRRYLNEVAIVGPADRYARSFHEFGAGAALMAPQGVIYNERYLALGAGVLVGPNVALTAGISPDQEMLTCPVVRIGARTIIGRGSHIIGHWSIEIGEDVQTGPYVYITDQNHGYDDVTRPISLQTQPERPVSIGDGSWIGHGSVVLPGSRIGRHVTIGANSVVSGEIPDFSVAVGSPARVIRRYVEGEGWVRVP